MRSPYSVRPVSCTGVSLIELMLTLAIAAILMTASAQSFVHWQRRSQVQAQAQSLLSAVHRARTLAVALGESVTLCPGGGDQTPCGGDYTQGFALISESRGLLRTWASRPAVSVYNREGSATVTHAVTWNPRGLANRNLTWSVCAVGVVSHAVVLNRLGRPSLRQGWGICPE